MVFISQLPWEELVEEDQLELELDDPFFFFFLKHNNNPEENQNSDRKLSFKQFCNSKHTFPQLNNWGPERADPNKNYTNYFFA